MQHIAENYIPKNEIRHEIEVVKADYKNDHRGIGEMVNLCRQELKKDNDRIEARIERLTEVIMLLAERRGQDRT